MKAIVVLLFTIAAVQVKCDVFVCPDVPINCLPDDEFLDGQTTTTEWDEFAENLKEATFEVYALTCKENKSQSVSIDYTSDLIWDLRFKIYNERRDKTKKTLNECYCSFSDCKSEEFRRCLAETRVDMSGEISTVMGAEISRELRRLAALC